MTVHLSLLTLIVIIGYLGHRLVRPPLWFVTVLVLGGFLGASSFLGPAIDSGARAGVAIVNSASR